MISKYPIKKVAELIEYETKRNTNNNVPYVGLEEILSNSGKFTGTREPKEVKSATYSFSPDHVLYGRLRPYLNKVLLPDFEGHCSSEIIPIKTKNTINKKFFFHWITSLPVVEKINKTCTGTRMPRANLNAILNLTIPLPPLPEQQRIVEILDQSFAAIDQVIENTEKNLRNVTALLESYINQFFTNHSNKWASMSLNQLSEIKYGYTEKSNFTKVGPKFLRITDIQNNSVDWNQVPYCTISEEDIKKYLLKNGDIVFARTGATTGKSYLIENPPNAVFASYLIRLRINLQDKLLPKFLVIFFKSKYYWDIIKLGLSGSTQGGFNASKLGNLAVPIPSIEEQLEFIDSMESFSNNADLLNLNYEKKRSQLQELKQSILHKAFQGEL